MKKSDNEYVRELNRLRKYDTRGGGDYFNPGGV